MGVEGEGGRFTVPKESLILRKREKYNSHKALSSR